MFLWLGLQNRANSYQDCMRNWCSGIGKQFFNRILAANLKQASMPSLQIPTFIPEEESCDNQLSSTRPNLINSSRAFSWPGQISGKQREVLRRKPEVSGIWHLDYPLVLRFLNDYAQSEPYEAMNLGIRTTRNGIHEHRKSIITGITIVITISNSAVVLFL